MAEVQFNWVGKSSDFTNPFVCGPAGGKVKKMSSGGSVSHMSLTIHIPNCSNLRANFKRDPAWGKVKK